jgi:ligand-binding sensor domain-containing protein
MRWRIIIILALLPVLLSGQGLTFRHVTIADGLNNGTINSIAQDSLGHLWVSTIGGLCCYNRTDERFDRYTIAGLPPRPVRSAVIEYDDELLVRVNGNVYYLPLGMADLREFRSIRVIGAEDEISDRFIRKIYSAENHLLLCFKKRDVEGNWFTQVYNGRKLDSIIRINDHFDFEVRGNIREIFMVGEKVHLATDAGYSMYDYATERFIRPEPLQEYGFSSMITGSDGAIWLGTDFSGLFRFNWETRQVDHYEHDPHGINSLLGNRISSLYEDFSGSRYRGIGGG